MTDLGFVVDSLLQSMTRQTSDPRLNAPYRRFETIERVHRRHGHQGLKRQEKRILVVMVHAKA